MSKVHVHVHYMHNCNFLQGSIKVNILCMPKLYTYAHIFCTGGCLVTSCEGFPHILLCMKSYRIEIPLILIIHHSCSLNKGTEKTGQVLEVHPGSSILLQNW